MSRLMPLALAAFLLIGAFLHISPGSPEGLSTRDGNVDITVRINLPQEGESYQTEFGLYVNATIINLGTGWANGSGRASMKIIDINNGQEAFSAFNVPFSGIEPGGQRNITFQNWSLAYPGQFMCNVSVFYTGDSNMSNNFGEVDFSMWTANWPFPPQIEAWSVDPKKGDTSTDFTYKVKYKHNEAPRTIWVEIDGVNHTLVESDPGDQIFQDGKYYEFTTKLGVGDHRFRFIVDVEGYDIFDTDLSSGPWVNISLRQGEVMPLTGYITTPFRFSVQYGSMANLPPDEIYVTAGSKRFNLTRFSPTPNYVKGDVRFDVDVIGMELLPSPLHYSFHVRTGNDTFGIGPFEMGGPSMELVNVTGRVTDEHGAPLQGVLVDLEPGSSALTNGTGSYRIPTYKGPDFEITYSKDGFVPREYQLDIWDNRTIDIVLEHIPLGASVGGRILMEEGGVLTGVEGALVNISGPMYSNETLSGSNGTYLFENIPAGDGYVLTVTEGRFLPYSVEFDISRDENIVMNVTLKERDMGVSVFPPPEGAPISVLPTFILIFPEAPDTSTVSISLRNDTASIPVNVSSGDNSTSLLARPGDPLNFNTRYTLMLKSGVRSLGGNRITWRDIGWDYVTVMQPFLEVPVTHPEQDEISVPLDTIITLSWGIALNMSSFSYEILDLDRVTTVSASMSHETTVNWSDSGRSETVVTVVPANLSHETRYSLEVSGGLKDVFGRVLLTSRFSLEFMTESEPDTDGDGHPDSMDAFPEDPREWSDLDHDGFGDQVSDEFPSDPNEWRDTDGDGIGDNSDRDDDNDGMPDEWELLYGLDPLDPGDAFTDLDGDGSSNLEEYLEGTDPSDKGSHPKKEETADITWLIIAGLAALLVVALVAWLLFSRSRVSSGVSEE